MRGLLKDVNKLRPLISKKDKRKLVALLGLMFLGSVLEAVGIGAIPAYVSLVMNPSSLAEIPWVGHWFTGLPDEISVDLLLWASGLLLGFIVLKNLFLTFVFYIQARVVRSQRVKLGDRVFKVYQLAPYEWHLQHSSSDLLRSIHNDTAQVVDGILMPVLNLIMALIMTSVIIVILVLSTPVVTLMALMATGIGLFTVIHIFQNHLRQIGGINWHETREMIKAIQQGFGSLIDARIIGCQDYLNKVYRRSLKRYTKAQLHQQTIQKSTPYAMETFAVLGLLTILLLLVKGADSLGEILPIIALLGVVMLRLKQLAGQIAAAINQMNVARAFIPGIVNDIAELEAIESTQHAHVSAIKIVDNFRVLKLEKVTYTYPENEVPAVRDISLELRRGESIAFVGATGCGKSTLVNLTLGLLEPKTGRITVNGTDIDQDMKGWRSHLGYIPQAIYLVDDTIRANVAFGIPPNEVNEDQLWSALRSARLDQYVLALPNGLDSVVGERGVRLSGGERQRLGIARALYPGPEVLVMDEATSALDNKTEEEVMQAIQNLKKGRTLIMIAHRLSTVEDCDRLYFLQDGQLKNGGHYNELVQNSAAFRGMAVANNI